MFKDLTISGKKVFIALGLVILTFPISYSLHLVDYGVTSLNIPLLGEISSNKTLPSGEVIGYSDWQTVLFVISELLNFTIVFFAIFILVFKNKVARNITFIILLISLLRLIEGLDFYGAWMEFTKFLILGILGFAIYFFTYKTNLRRDRKIDELTATLDKLYNSNIPEVQEQLHQLSLSISSMEDYHEVEKWKTVLDRKAREGDNILEKSLTQIEQTYERIK